MEKYDKPAYVHFSAVDFWNHHYSLALMRLMLNGRDRYPLTACVLARPKKITVAGLLVKSQEFEKGIVNLTADPGMFCGPAIHEMNGLGLRSTTVVFFSLAGTTSLWSLQSFLYLQSVSQNSELPGDPYQHCRMGGILR
jgi:hypothetical protein